MNPVRRLTRVQNTLQACKTYAKSEIYSDCRRGWDLRICGDISVQCV